MAGRSTVWKNPLVAQFIRENGPALGFQSLAHYEALCRAFPEIRNQTFPAFKNYAHYVHYGGGGISIPVADVPDVNEHVLHLPWKTVLITGDYQIPYHDEEFVRFAFELGKAWQVDGHVFNADVFDMATMSKFPQQIFGERVQLGEELKIGRDIIKLSRELHGQVAFNTGNHEWRILTRLLHGELDPDQVRDLLAGEGVLYTPLSYCWLGYDENNAVRVTHPKSQSVIAGAVGADIARNHDCHVVVAHDHLIAQRRSHSGRWTVTHAGMMANPGKLMYAVTADDRRPRMNQGFAIVHPDSKSGEPRVRLIDARNVDRELEFWVARGRSKWSLSGNASAINSRPVPKRAGARNASAASPVN